MPGTILVNDDGWLMSQNQPPLTPEILRERMVTPYRDTPVDALLWSIGGGQVYHYETEIGEIYGESYAHLDAAGRQTQNNIRSIAQSHGGPLTALIRVAREEGLRLFASLRINNHYEVDHSSPSFSHMRREHPEWLIGHGEELTPNSIEWGIREGLNFAVPQVREYMVSIICELFERFDVDGVELDFQRHPGMFRVEEGFSCRHLITDMIWQVRARIDAVNASRNRKVELAVRVPETQADAARLGLDVAAWMAGGLIDIALVGGGFIPFDMKIEEFVEAARDTYTRVYGCIESMRPAAHDETIRGIASRIWESGADGLYLFNYFGRSAEWKHRLLNEIASPAALAELDKRFEIDHTDRVLGPGQIGGAFRHGHPPLQLPTTLAPSPSGTGPTLWIPIAGDLESATACTLRLRLERLAPHDRLSVRLNGAQLQWDSATVSAEPWANTTHSDSSDAAIRTGWRRWPWYYQEIAEPATVVELCVDAPPLERGANEIQVALIRGDASTQPVILRDVEIDVVYLKRKEHT